MLDKRLSGRRFTTSAIHIVEQIGSRAADRSMSSEFTEQTVPMLVLWSLLRWERKVGLVALERLGVEPDALARDVDRGLSEACAEHRRHAGPPQFLTLPGGRHGIVVDFETPLEPLLEAAEGEAHDLGHNWVGSEHLLLAVVRLADPQLAGLLDRHGVAYDGARRAVVAVLQS